METLKIDGIEKFVSQINCGSNHTLLLTNDGKVYATGYNEYGQLGDGTDKQSLSFIYVKNQNTEYLSKIVNNAKDTILKNDFS